jgi:hypothetical protein
MAIGDLAKQIQQPDDSRLRERLTEVDPMSPAWSGIIAELEYRASEKLQRQTRTLIRLTWAIIALTFALLFYTVELYQSAKTEKKRDGLQQNANEQNVTHNQPPSLINDWNAASIISPSAAGRPLAVVMTSSQDVYEVRPRKDHRGVDLISDALPFGRLWYGEPDAISNAVDYAKFRSRSHRAVTQIEKLNALPPRTQREYELFPKGEYALGRAWKSGGFPLSYFLSRMGDPMSSGVFLKNKSK